MVTEVPVVGPEVGDRAVTARRAGAGSANENWSALSMALVPLRPAS